MPLPSKHPDKDRTLRRIQSGKETMAQAAVRLGLSRQRVHQWCVAAGVKPQKVDDVRPDAERRAVKLRDLARELRADPEFAKAAAKVIIDHLEGGRGQTKAGQRRVLSLLVNKVATAHAKAR